MAMRARQSGFSLVEVSLVSVVLVVMSAVIVQSLRGLTSTQSSVHSHAKVTSLAERVGARIEADVGYATRVFREGDAARAFLALMDIEALTDGNGPLPGSRLPAATLLGVFDRDPEDTIETGNVLFLVRRDGTLAVDSAIPTVVPPAPAPALRRVDVFRFIVWYLHDGAESGLDLARWCSVRLARLQDIDGIADPARRAHLVKGLFAAGVTLAWDPAASAATAFRALDDDGGITPLVTGAQVPPDAGLSEAGIMSTRHVGIARNGTMAPRVPRFAKAVTGFPHGFELKRDGSGSGDLLLVRMVVTTPVGGQRVVNTAEVVRQIAFREE